MELNIDELGVYELRELARKLGVKSPTTKKIAQLKQEIKMIQSGQMKGISTNKIGRPPKSMIRQSGDLSAYFIPQDIAQIINERGKNFSEEELNLKKLMFKSNVQTYEDNYANGYLRKTDANHFYFWTQTQNCFKKDMLVYVSDAFADEYSLRIGDYLQTKVELYEENNYAIVSKIIRVNGVEFEGKRVESVDLNQLAYPDTHMEVMFGEKMNKGGRAMAVFDGRAEMSNAIGYAQQMSEKGFRVLLCGCEVTPELFSFATNRNLELFVSKFGDGFQNSYNTMVNVINHAKSLASDHNDVVIVMYDLFGMVETMKMYFESIGQHPINGVQMVKSIFGMGANFCGEATISTIACMQKKEYWTDFVQNELSRASSCVIGNY